MGIDTPINTVLLVCCIVSLLIALLSTAMNILITIRNRRKNDSLVELLHAQSRQHTQELLTMNDQFNNRLYNFQEKVQLEHVATLRLLLESMAIAASGKPDV